MEKGRVSPPENSLSSTLGGFVVSGVSVKIGVGMMCVVPIYKSREKKRIQSESWSGVFEGSSGRGMFVGFFSMHGYSPSSYASEFRLALFRAGEFRPGNLIVKGG